MTYEYVALAVAVLLLLIGVIVRFSRLEGRVEQVEATLLEYQERHWSLTDQIEGVEARVFPLERSAELVGMDVRAHAARLNQLDKQCAVTPAVAKVLPPVPKVAARPLGSRPTKPAKPNSKPRA